MKFKKSKSLTSVLIILMFMITNLVVPMPLSYADPGMAAGAGMMDGARPEVRANEAEGNEEAEEEQEPPTLNDDNPLQRAEEPPIDPEQFERHLQNLKRMEKNLEKLINPDDIKQRELGGKLPDPTVAEPRKEYLKKLYQEQFAFRNHLIKVKNRIVEIIINMEDVQRGLRSSIPGEYSRAITLLESEEGDEIKLSLQLGGRQKRILDLYYTHTKQLLRLETLMLDKEEDFKVIREKLEDLQERLINHQRNIFPLEDEDVDDVPLAPDEKGEVIDALMAEGDAIARDQLQVDRALNREFQPVKAKKPLKKFVPPVIPGGGFVVNPGAVVIAKLQAEILWQETQIVAQILAIENAFKANRVPPKMVSEMNRRLFILKFIQLPMTLVLKRTLGAVIAIVGVRNVINVLTNRHNIIVGDYLILKREGWMR